MKSESKPAYQLETVNLRGIGAAVFVLAVLSVCALLASRWLLRRFSAGKPQAQVHALAVEGELPPAPRLQTSVRGDIEAHQRLEEHLLTTYGWIDRDARVVRIPLERALELTLERGLPSRPEIPPSPRGRQ
jgi:hypothetical protein